VTSTTAEFSARDRGRAHEAAAERVVVADEGVLDDVRDDQEHDQVERRELTDLALAGEAERHEQEEVHDDGAEDLLGDRNVGHKDVEHGASRVFVGGALGRIDPPRVRPGPGRDLAPLAPAISAATCGRRPRPP